MATVRLRDAWLHRKSHLTPYIDLETQRAHVQGRPFAWQEAQITLVTILQRFDLVMVDPSYELELKQTLTIKPHNFFINALPRKNKPRLLAVPSSALSPAGPAAAQGPSTTVDKEAGKLQQMYVLYGSNTGNSESFAQRIASDASAHGKCLPLIYARVS